MAERQRSQPKGVVPSLDPFSCLVQAKKICSSKRRRCLTLIRGSGILLAARLREGFREATFRGLFFAVISLIRLQITRHASPRQIATGDKVEGSDVSPTRAQQRVTPHGGSPARLDRAQATVDDKAPKAGAAFLVEGERDPFSLRSIRATFLATVVGPKWGAIPSEAVGQRRESLANARPTGGQELESEKKLEYRFLRGALLRRSATPSIAGGQPLKPDRRFYTWRGIARLNRDEPGTFGLVYGQGGHDRLATEATVFQGRSEGCPLDEGEVLTLVVLLTLGDHKLVVVQLR